MIMKEHCPYCGSEEIEAIDNSCWDDIIIFNTAYHECCKCGQTFRIFTRYEATEREYFASYDSVVPIKTERN